MELTKSQKEFLEKSANTAEELEADAYTAVNELKRDLCREERRYEYAQELKRAINNMLNGVDKFD